MDIQVLGQVEVRLNGRSIVPQAGKPRQIIALLGLNVGKLVPVSTIVDELWGEFPPVSARTTLQTYIMQIRRMIRTADESCDPKQVLVTRGDGYLLASTEANCDVYQFGALAGAGYRAMRAGRADEASAAFADALGLWRGPALVDVPVGMPLTHEVTRLQEQRLGVMEARFEAELQLGRHLDVVSELAYQVSLQPMNENLCAKYVLALYRCGRQAQAQTALRSLRNTLCEELGVEPSRATRELHGAILRGDVSLDLHPLSLVAAA